MMKEYAAVYGGPPPGEMSWRLFLLLVDGAAMVWARRELIAFDAHRGAEAASRSKTSSSQAARDALVKAAYPVKRKARALIPNMFAETGDDDGDTDGG